MRRRVASSFVRSLGSRGGRAAVTASIPQTVWSRHGTRCSSSSQRSWRSLFTENGYVVPEFRLPSGRVSQLQGALEKLMQDNPDVEPEKLLNAHMQTLEGGSSPFLELGRDPALLDIVATVLETQDIFLWAGQVFCKPAGTGRSVPWHQDGQYWPIMPMRAATAWVALDESTKENGCLQIIPGSHRQLYPHEHKVAPDSAIDFVVERDVFDSGRLLEQDAQFIELNAGEVEVHHPYIVHQSARNDSSLRRAGIALGYMPADCEFERHGQSLGEKLGGINLDYTQRPLYLVRGESRNANNTLVIDARP